MSPLWHLVRHDLRAHRAILLAWLGIVITMPVAATLPWSVEASAGFGVGAAFLLQAVRVLLGTAAVASIVQATSPIDDRAFWRTRPIAPGTLAAAHLATAAAVFVVVPTLVVLTIAVLFGVPRTHWVPSVVQVATVESAIAAFSLVIASRTRGLATFIIATVVGLVSFYLFVGAMYEMRRVLQWPGLVQMADPLKGLWATLGIGALLLPLLFVVAMAGPRRQRAFLAGVLGVLVLGVGVWFLPALRFEPPPMIDAGLTFDASSLRVEAVPNSPGAAALVLVARPTKTQPRDQWRFWMKHGTLRTQVGTRPLKGSPTGHVPGVTATEHPVVIAMLSAADVAQLAGTRVRVQASVLGDVERHVTEASATVAPGAVLQTDHQQLKVGRPIDWESEAGRRIDRLAGAPANKASAEAFYARVRPTVAATEIYLSTPRLAFRHAHAYILRDPESSCEVPVYSWPGPAARVTGLALLPTLLPPFTVMPTELAERVISSCRVDTSRASIEMRSDETRTVSVPPVSLEFTFPAVLAPSTIPSAATASRPQPR